MLPPDQNNECIDYFTRKVTMVDIISILKDLDMFTVITVTDSHTQHKVFAIDDLTTVPKSDWCTFSVKVGNSEESFELRLDSLFGCSPYWPDNIFYVLCKNNIEYPAWFYNKYAKLWDGPNYLYGSSIRPF